MSQVARVAMIDEFELRAIMREEAANAYREVLAEQQDELLTIGQLCEKIPGMTRYVFSKLQKTAHLKNVRGKYSLKTVKAAMQSQ
ncbi:MULTISPECIES: hypothetical protein [Acinetobacter]|uniref:Uncharacterized protein n=1 Tax=Acinetobacter corruptisaponis TaxID=3045147 RepID=A0ABY8S4I1_9GAMM|nr:hypothetical protein [Acinetobacter sp. KCTC 92772]WHP05757.1 hypothetical protein QLH32_17415 [Acinetobacter sp. KCTC 92772]